MVENLEISNFFLTKVKFKVKKDSDIVKSEEEDEMQPIFSVRFENLDHPCFSCKRDKFMDVVLSLFQSEGYDGSFELDIALPSVNQRFEVVDLHDVQISLFEKNESKLATFNQKFPENLGLRDEPPSPDHEDELVKDVFTFKINDILKIFTNEEIQDKFEYAGKFSVNIYNLRLEKYVSKFFLFSVGHILVSYKLLESCQFCDYVHSNQNAMLNHYYSIHFQKQCLKDLNEFFPNGSRYCSKCNYDNTYETNSNLLKALCHVCYHKLPEYIKDLKEPKVNSLAAINKIYGDQAEETVPVLKLPDSEDEHNEDDTERNVEVAKVKSHTVEIT